MDARSAADIIAALGLEPNQTCGWVRVTYSNEITVHGDALPEPFQASRPLGSALYFLVEPAAPVQLHRIANDQLYHYYAGDAIELLLLHADGSSQLHRVGPDILGGEHVQLLIPGGTFHTARLAAGGRWFLGGSTEWPGVIPEDVELGDAAALAERHPDVADLIHEFPTPR